MEETLNGRVSKAICIPIKEDRWYTTRTIGWKIIDANSDKVLGTVRQQYAEQVSALIKLN